MSQILKKDKRPGSLRTKNRNGCPLTHNRTPWCFNLCKPNLKGEGVCGRVAPYHLDGRTRRSIRDYKQNAAA